ncbi:clotting factor G beta subunit isoform X2 [Aethina tumida]|uniref:clotting factor G beta subunit isoform X2 n=1 Tax=Aethina tumida TaxID=116153 RepID=UPI00096AFC0D|nr:clotting factor G beta subunit isoform X2 [Aethina tumida]
MNVLYTFTAATVLNIIFIIIQAFQCGKPSGGEYRIEERIVSGYDVGYYKYPWQGLANLTDAYEVSIGVYDWCERNTTRQNYTLIEVIPHEKYWDYQPYYDIAILVLDNPTDQFTPICLPPANVKFKPKEGIVVGLGSLKYNGEAPCKLNEARLLIYTDKECHKMLNETGNNDTLIKSAFCAGYLAGGIDACQGDSGGPLQVIGSNGNYVQIGIVSFGFKCASPGLLGLYTDVSMYTSWINDKLDYIESKYRTPNIYRHRFFGFTSSDLHILYIIVVTFWLLFIIGCFLFRIIH